MKNTWKFIIGAFMAASVFSCEKDQFGLEHPIGKPIGKPVKANFENPGGALYENDADGATVNILFSAPVKESGTVIIQLEGQPGAAPFTTEPAIDASGRLELEVAVGATSAGFALLPVNDAVGNGNQTAVFSIIGAEGGIVKGNKLSYELSVMDDELLARAKSYQTYAGNWRVKRTYAYGASGKVAKVNWEKATPALTTGTEAYTYAGNGLIERVNYYPDNDEYFFQENGRIIRSEKIVNGLKTAYSEYDYDPAGNVGSKALYNRQSSGEFALSFVFVYLYYEDGNLYKQLTYYPIAGGEELELISTRTYEGYGDKANLFPLELIPGIAAQRTLPTSFRLEEHGMELEYKFSYEFREDGLPVKRHTSGAGSEVTEYEYY